ncbi:MAG: BrnT family toxin [Treponema sp.]|jgi:hypothetical protein|nr:BrnT family toxin [Treponema sp.]
MTIEWDENKNQENIEKHNVSFEVAQGAFFDKVIYTEAPKSISMEITEGEVVSDFLPPPEELIRKEPKVKITITLNSESIDFFKKFAKKNNVK